MAAMLAAQGGEAAPARPATPAAAGERNASIPYSGITPAAPSAKPAAEQRATIEGRARAGRRAMEKEGLNEDPEILERIYLERRCRHRRRRNAG